MPMIPDIKFEDITLAVEKFTQGYGDGRSKNGLWSIYNVIRKIIADYSEINGLPLHYSCSDKDGEYIKIIECLYMIGVNAKFSRKSVFFERI